MKTLISILLPIIICVGCKNSPHFISDTSIREQVANDFEAKQNALPHGNLFEVFKESLSDIEREALTFLYAYMPIGDVTDYSGEFYLQNIRSAFRVKEEMPWGKNIPEEIFRHFVLPVRVNNENMDDSRMVFYEELKDRVKNLSLYDAVLEVNHWCHEKVIYTPSDSRTSSPLASVRTAYGRCGEESVFTVAALRSVGIPARQVYTPRWAHTDDNHAWVEAWVDGKWYFLGACEPEPVLNMAWFNEPASRGMLMHTRAFGRYNGPEEIMEVTNCFTEINVTDNYAPTASINVIVQNTSGETVKDAQVEFKIYNYAEFYTVARKKTDKNGTASLSAGKGDMLVWVTHNNKFGYQKVSFGKDSNVTIVLDKTPGDCVDIEMEVTPPASHPIPVDVTEEQIAENAKRLLMEDEIRNKYVSTFYTDNKTDNRFLIASRGNFAEIEKFINTLTDENRSAGMELLNMISAKDLRDVPSDILLDHLLNIPYSLLDSQLATYILSPRVSNELLTAYRSFFQHAFDEEQIKKFQNNPQLLVQWVKENIEINDNLNPQRIPVMPMGVYKARVADTHSYNIFFVALARSFHIPARIESVTRKVQYHINNTWVDVDFEASAPVIAAQGELTASYNPIKTLRDPKYHSHFTVAKILSDGSLQTLNFRSGSVDMGIGNTWAQMLRKPLAMDEGNYLLVTGNRMAKGNVLSQITSFNIQPGKTAHIPLVMRENPEDIQVIGSVDAEKTFRRVDDNQETSILATTGRGYYVIGVLGARQEPTNHAMRDIAAVANELNEWNRGIILLFKNEQEWNSFDTNEFGQLPTTVTYGIDEDNKITNMIASAMEISNTNNLPIFIIADTFGRVVFVSQGYTIGLGEQMLGVIGKI
ncbi:transglutaminase domain-containing protein [Bacteroides sp. 519]|uniref:transglutaminase domain-containing protein n=1 Tax=Bacteroides sp. 519 TaxID=2302937 RepID=UPI0013D5024F|nr:transglutaminase-like domain-containing protein [Bacteroides sp. 519]NDV58144.1 transglutaminase domain-containing protein [Bacteroides sp. 519]